MNVSKKSAKFFCENCGAEVPQNAKVCRYCGKFFSSVRCPVCNATGTPEQFTKGCPVCGYAEGNGENSKSFNKKKFNSQKASRKSKNNLKSQINLKGKEFNFSTEKNDDSLPVWVYFTALFALLFIIFLVFKFYL